MPAHRYWIHARIQMPPTGDGEPRQVEGSFAIERPIPVSKFEHMGEMAQQIANSVIQDQKLPHDIMLNVLILSFSKLEEETLILAPVRRGMQ